jgi:phosphatidylglycerophosphate synthase
MHRISPTLQSALRLLAILASTGLLAYLVWQAGPGILWHNLVRLGWGFTLVIALAGVAHLARTWAWQLTLGKDRHKISFKNLVGLRLGAEAAGQLGIVGQTFGDSIRVSHLSRQMQMGHSLASVTLDRGLYLVTGIIVMVSGLFAALPTLSLSHALRFYAGLFALGSITFLSLTLLVLRKRSPVLSQGARLIGRIPALKNWIEQRLHLIQSMESALFDFHHNTPRLFWGGLLLNLAGHCLAILEVCGVLWLLGAHIGFVAALIIEGLTKLVNALGNLNPGNIGTYESGTVLIGKVFGLSNAAGLALAIARRLRALFWTTVGCSCLVLLTRSKRLNDLGTIEKESPTQGSSSPADFLSSLSYGSVTFAILLPSTYTRFPLARVGTLPIALRTILVAQRMNSVQIFVVADAATRRCAPDELMHTGRLPESVQWLEANADASLRDRLRLVASRVKSQRVILVDGSTTYNTSLIQQAVEWNNEDTALALTSADVPAGLYAMLVETLREVITHCPSDASSLEELLASNSYRHSVVSMNVSEDLWQRVRTENDRRIAERKLDGWLVKPTDGMYARLNRRISIPISRQLIRLPISANMVSLITLGVGIASAAFFALGGYWNTLLGAFLCLFASILDGCDGEVARLKLLESDFGCWLETVCDYVFYFFLLIGMTVGQWRSSGSGAYLVWGGFLLVGALASFLAVGWQRRRLAAGRPEQLLNIWQRHAERRSSNPFLYAARHMEFMVRRCFFPYALVVFALLGVMKVAFILSVIGANLVWPVALYSAQTFARGRSSAPEIPAASAEASAACVNMHQLSLNRNC